MGARGLIRHTNTAGMKTPNTQTLWLVVSRAKAYTEPLPGLPELWGGGVPDLQPQKPAKLFVTPCLL